MTRTPGATLSTGPVAPGHGIVVSPHVLASAAGIGILRSGGNAVDAAIAVDAVLAVVLPDTCGPGGDLFAIVHRRGSAPIALNASGRAGSGETAVSLRDRDLGSIPYRSPWSITVPGCVDGWHALAQRFGALPLASVLAPAIAIAREGFAASSELAGSLDRLVPLIADQPSATELYPGGAPPARGAMLHRPRFAATLEDVATGGREAFFGGAVGDGIVTATNGAVTKDDLTIDQATWIEPLGLDLFGRTAWTIPPNSQGYLTLATLWLFDQLDAPADPLDPRFHHLLIEAYRSVAWERADTVADPDHVAIPASELIASSRLSERLVRIDQNRATRWPMPMPAPGGTAYMTALDGDGLGISLIQSNFAGIGSGRSAGDTGVWLHNRGAGFNLIPGHPNEYAPGKRPLHTLSPTLWTRGDDLDLLLGTRGGDQQPQYLAQVAAQRYVAGASPVDAQAASRWSMAQPLPGTDSHIEVEETLDPSIVGWLERAGHQVDVVPTPQPGWGPVSIITVDGDRVGAADPRVSTSAALTTA